MHTVVQSEPGLWTVGYYQPDGSWVAMRDLHDWEEAHEYAAHLNGAPYPAASVAVKADLICQVTAGVDVQAASERHFEWLTTVPGLVAHMLLADENDDGLDLPAPEPREVAQPDIDEEPWGLYAWLRRRLGPEHGDRVWVQALRWYGAIMAGQDPAPAEEPEHEPVVDERTGIPVGETLLVRCAAGSLVGPPSETEDWRTSDVGILFFPTGKNHWMFVPWGHVASIEVDADG